MKVLLVGATGNLGLRLVPALLTHNHTVIAFVRSADKLASLLPDPVFRQLTVISGNATDTPAIKSAILDHRCDGVVNVAGLAALPPWGKTDLPEIFRAVVDAVREAGAERGEPLRAWFLGGLGVLGFPGGEEGGAMLSDYIPIYLAHRLNLALLRSLPPTSIDWSLLCPLTMTPESANFTVPTHPSPRGRLVAQASTPPHWQDSWVKHVPLLGRPLLCAWNTGRYETSLEQNAEFIAGDLEVRESQWEGCAVGVIDAAR